MSGGATAEAAGRPESLYRKLKPGPGRPAEEVAENQLGRLRGALIELAAERGYEAFTVLDVTDTAGVSKPTFYKFFEDKESCFLATYDLVVRCAARDVLASQVADSPWRARLRAGVRALFAKFAEAPKAARMALLSFYDVGPEAERLDRRTAALFATMLRNAAGEPPGEAEVSPLLARCVVAGAAEVARARMLAVAEPAFEELAGPVSGWALRVCEGAGARLGELYRGGGPGAAGAEELLRGLERPEGPRSVRGLILSACTRTAATEGYQDLTAEKICATAGVSRRAFRAEFAGVPDCFLAATRRRSDQLLEALAAAREAGGGWEGGVRRVVQALCATAARDLTVRPLFVDLPAAGLDGVQVRSRAIAGLAAILAEGGPGDEATELAAHASAAAAWSAIHDQLAAGRPAALDRLAGPLASVCLASAGRD